MYEKYRPEDIDKCEVHRDDVRITLVNGVTLYISSNPGYIHVHLSGIGYGGLVVAPANHPNHQIELANYFDIKYEPITKQK